MIQTDVFVKDGRVLALGQLEEMKALQEIDTRGLIVMPGNLDKLKDMWDEGAVVAFKTFVCELHGAENGRPTGQPGGGRFVPRKTSV